MKVVIIGGAGYIGLHLVLGALERGCDVMVFVDLSKGCKENINQKIQSIHSSTLSTSNLSKLFTLNRYDAVV